MAQKRLIARAGQGLLNGSKLLLRGVAALCSAFGTVVLFAFRNEGPQSGGESPHTSESGERIVGQDEAEHYGWDSW